MGDFVLARGIYRVYLVSWLHRLPYRRAEVNPKSPLLPPALLKVELFLTWRESCVGLNLSGELPKKIRNNTNSSSWEKQVLSSVCSPVIISNPSSIILTWEEASPVSNDIKQTDNLFQRYYKTRIFNFLSHTKDRQNHTSSFIQNIKEIKTAQSIIRSSLGIFSGLFFWLSSIVTALQCRGVVCFFGNIKCYLEPRVVKKKSKSIGSDAERDTNQIIIQLIFLYF